MVAPMSGGPTTPELVASAAQAGALGFLASGYKTAAAMDADLAALRAISGAAFGVNLFVPQPSTADPARVAAYIETLDADAGRLRTAPGLPVWDDDDWGAKIASLLANPPAIVSFTFGCPSDAVVAEFHARDTTIVITVTTPDEAMLAVAVGADLLCAQGFEAGTHRGTFANADRLEQDFGLLALIGEIQRVTGVPIIAAGGIAGPREVAAVFAAGAIAVQAGTAFLRCPESGTRPTHRDALVDSRYTGTAITRAFTGRRARGLVNQFMLDHPDAPPAYPEIHHVTRTLRAAAAAADDADRLNLWAGQGYRRAAELPAGDVVEQLAQGLPPSS